MEISPPITIDYDELVFKSRRKVLLVIEGDEYWFDLDDVELDEKSFTVEISEYRARKEGFI